MDLLALEIFIGYFIAVLLVRKKRDNWLFNIFLIFISMKNKAHKILDCKLIKVEKLYNQTKPHKLFYNLTLEDMDEILLLETNTQIQPDLIGQKIKYKLNAENEVSEFEFL